jgi:hypothetical protein
MDIKFNNLSIVYTFQIYDVDDYFFLPTLWLSSAYIDTY